MDALLQVRIPSELKDRMKSIEIRYGISMSEQTRRAVSDLADKIERTKASLPRKP